VLEHGRLIRFGAGGRKGIVLHGMEPQVGVVGENGVREEDLLVHDTRSSSPAMACLLASLEPPTFPKAFGIFRQIERPTYESLLVGQIEQAIAKKGHGQLARLLDGGTTWTVD
jgi:2-oxoglutarate ferredoxin oxidoreductase subunit beta